MPKVTDAHREARRQQIAGAAIACLERKGLSSTSMADIIAESGLSAGAIYSNFENKAELIHYVATSVVGQRITEVAQNPGTPEQVALGMLEGISGTRIPVAVIVQVWGEATADADLRHVLDSVVGELRAAFGAGISAWVAARHPTDPDAETERLARVLLAVCQGYIVSSALFGAREPKEYLQGVGQLLA